MKTIKYKVFLVLTWLLIVNIAAAQSGVLDYDLALVPEEIESTYVNVQFNAGYDAYWEKVITSNIELESCSTSGNGYGCAIKNNTVTVFKDFINSNVMYDEENATVYVKSVSQETVEIPVAVKLVNPTYYYPIYSDTELFSPIFRIKDHTTIGVSVFPVLFFIILIVYIDRRRKRRR